MFHYRIMFEDVGGRKYADDYTSTSTFFSRHEAALAAEDFIRRFQAVKPGAICKIRFVAT